MNIKWGIDKVRIIVSRRCRTQTVRIGVPCVHVIMS